MKLRCAYFFHLLCIILRIRCVAAQFEQNYRRHDDNKHFVEKQRHTMDSSDTCGKTKDDSDFNGEIWSHAGAISDILNTNYDDTTDCVTTIDVTTLPASDDWRIQVHFLTIMDLGILQDQENCDKLDIYSGYKDNANARLIATFCGGRQSKPKPLETDGPILTLHFHCNNDGATGTGFGLTYSVFRLLDSGEPACDIDSEHSCDSRCVPTEYLCDDVVQCVDGTDEKKDAYGDPCGANLLEKIAALYTDDMSWYMIGIGVVLVGAIISGLCRYFYIRQAARHAAQQPMSPPTDTSQVVPPSGNPINSQMAPPFGNPNHPQVAPPPVYPAFGHQHAPMPPPPAYPANPTGAPVYSSYPSGPHYA